MTENLPLIPNKRGCVGDVRPVLREVFRERGACLPPLPAAKPPREPATRRRIYSGCPCDCPCDDPQFTSEQEEGLRSRRGRQLARDPSPHPYRLCNASAASVSDSGVNYCKLLQRSDLMSRIDQNAARETSLWIRNVLNQSSGDVSELKVTGRRQRPSLTLTSPTKCQSEQSLSIGEVTVREPTTNYSLLTKPIKAPLPKLIVCIPTSLNFINFTLGSCYTQPLRLVNMSKREVLVSVRPPARRELNLQVCGRLRVVPGADCDLLVRFEPRDVRALADTVLIRVAGGRTIQIPISCYIKPPILHVIMPNLGGSMLSCALEGMPASSDCGGGGGGGDGGGAELLDLGARLLGEVHCAHLVLRSQYGHVTFFLITEDAWNSQDLSDVCRSGSVVCSGVSGVFAAWPAHWRGGSETRGAAWCRAHAAGLHYAALRLVATNAITRPLHLIADALFFYPEHITLQAQEKNYDICSESDPDCEYYVNLGTTFPHQSLASSVLILNHSPLTFSFYWSVRAWGKCSCWREELVMGTWLGSEDDPERLCAGAREARAATTASRTDADVAEAESVGESHTSSTSSHMSAAAAAVRVEPASGAVAPRSSVPLHVAVPDVGDRLGTQRAVLVLILKDIPRKSFPRGFYPMIVSTSTVKTEHIPGLKREERVLCDVVCCQMEVWWHVAPLRFVLDPPYLALKYSRRVRSVAVCVRATQVFAGGCARAAWRCSLPGAALPAALEMQPERPQFAIVTLPLPHLPNEFAATETITLEEERGRWWSRAVVTRQCATRHPALLAHCTWLGLVPPGDRVHTALTLLNDTHQDIYWWGDVHCLLLERRPNEECMSRPYPCKKCKDRSCGCLLLQPTRGAVPQDHSTIIQYNAIAPDDDGCVVTFFRVRRTEADCGRVPRAAPVCSRAALISYRVLAPLVTLSVTYCGGEAGDCEFSCAVEPCDGAVLRPARPLVAGLRTCYQLHLTNHTPIKTHVKWEPPLDGDEKLLRTIFLPNEIFMKEYEEIDVQVVLEARGVCARRAWVRRALVARAHQPLYLLIETAITGLEVDFWLPLPNHSFCLRRKQQESFPWSQPLPKTAEEAFARNDVLASERICSCKPRYKWIPSPPPECIPGREPPLIPIIVTSSPVLTRQCPCFGRSRPLQPAPEPIALEVRDLPLRTVRTLRVRMRSACSLAGRWAARARLGSLAPPLTRTLRLGEDRWSALVLARGACVRVSPARGVLGSRAVQDIQVRVYADTWGIFRDQILILMDGLEPLVLNLWVQAVGCPLQCPLRPHSENQLPALWVSSADPDHAVRARNTSRAPLLLHAYLLRDHEHKQDAYPFRLCIRLFDVTPPLCPCVFTCDVPEASVSGAGEGAGEQSAAASLPTVSADSMATGVELFLAPDHGTQHSEYFKVEPAEQRVLPGDTAEWRVSMLPPPAPPPAPARPMQQPPDHTLLLRILPLEPQGPWWYRDEPAPMAVQIRVATRASALQLSRETIVVHLSGLDLPYNEVLRVRKRMTVQNIGNGPLIMSVRVYKENMYQNWNVSEKADDDSEIAENSAVDPGNISLAGDIMTLRAAESSVSAAPREEPQWVVVVGERRGECGGNACHSRQRQARQEQIELNLLPNGSTELCVEVSVRIVDMCPPRWDGMRRCASGAGSAGGAGGAGGAEQTEVTERDKWEEQLPARYEEERTFTSELQFYDDDNVLKVVPLVLQLQLPHVVVTPAVIELGYVCDGDTRKAYFTVSHTNRHESMTLFVTWNGGVEFRLQPTCLRLAPGAEINVYVIYTGRYTGAVSEGWAELRAGGGAGAWCCAAVRVRARASRDYRCHLPPHDHTDDCTLLAPDIFLTHT